MEGSVKKYSILTDAIKIYLGGKIRDQRYN
jgi:hypothetical protein